MALVKNPLFARYFNRFAARREDRGNRELRRELLAGLAGRVIEVGAGNGLNFPHYPLAVREVVAVEPEPYLRGRGHQAAAVAPVPIRVTDGTAGDLPAADGEFDAVVVSGLLCSVTDVQAALAEFRRVPRRAPDPGRHRRGIHDRGVPWFPLPARRCLLTGRAPDLRRRPQGGCARQLDTRGFRARPTAA